MIKSYITSLGALAMPDNKAPSCVIETLIVLIIWVINMHRSGYKLADIFNRFFYEWKYVCFNSDIIEVYSANGLINDKSAFA